MFKVNKSSVISTVGGLKRGKTQVNLNVINQACVFQFDPRFEVVFFTCTLQIGISTIFCFYMTTIALKVLSDI